MAPCLEQYTLEGLEDRREEERAFAKWWEESGNAKRQAEEVARRAAANKKGAKEVCYLSMGRCICPTFLCSNPVKVYEEAAAEEAAEKAKAASREKEPTIATGADPAANADTPDGPSDKPAFTPGLLLRFSLGADVAEGVRREDLSEALAGFDAPKFIDFKMGDTGGCLRFEDAETVANIVAKHGPGEAAAPLEVGGAPVAFAEMRGDEEAAYWRALAARSGQDTFRRGGRGGRGRGGGRGGGRGRGGRGKRGNDGGGGGGKRARN